MRAHTYIHLSALRCCIVNLKSIGAAFGFTQMLWSTRRLGPIVETRGLRASAHRGHYCDAFSACTHVHTFLCVVVRIVH